MFKRGVESLNFEYLFYSRLCSVLLVYRLSCSVVSNSLQAHGLWPTRLLSSVLGISKARILELSFLSPEDLPDPRIKPMSLVAPALQGPISIVTQNLLKKKKTKT